MMDLVVIFITGLFSVFGLVIAYLNNKYNNTRESLKRKEGELANEVRHNEASQRRKEIDEHVNGLDDSYIRDQLRKRQNGNG